MYSEYKCSEFCRDSYVDEADDEVDITADVHNITVDSDVNEEDDDQQQGKLPAGVRQVQRATLDTVTNSRFLVETSQLLQLAGLVPLKLCKKKGCVEQLSIVTKKCGTAVYLKWVSAFAR